MKMKKKTKKKIASLVVLGALLASSYVMELINPVETFAPQAPENSILSFEAIDIGQGHATLIRTDSKTVLVDGGETDQSYKLMEYLEQNNVEKIDLVVATHPHTDHYGGLIDVLNKYEVTELILPKLSEQNTPTNKTFGKFLDAIENNGCKFTLLSQKQEIDLGGATLSLIGPFLYDVENLNNTSLACRVDAGEASFLITGDGETMVEDALRESEDVDVDVLLAGHHGSGTSSRPKFLDVVTPVLSLVSVGADNSYNLPKQDVIDRLSAFGDVLRTDIEGSIVLTTDGENIGVVTENGEEFAVSARG